MKKTLLATLLTGLAILFCNNVFAQTWADVIAEEKGDTAVVKGVIASAGVINTLWIAVKGDTLADGSRANPNRIYETIPGDVYLTDGTLELDASVPMLKIVAPPIDRSGSTVPPLHIKQTQVDGSFDKTFFQVNGDIYMENQYFLLALTNNTLDREVQRTLKDSTHTWYHNCIFEFTNWVLCFPSAQHQSFKFTDCLFINIGNEPTIEKGLPFDHWNVPDTLWMENCTVLNAGGVAVGRTPDKVSPNFSYFNHNTFVNTTLNPFTFFTQAEMIATNNLMVNSGMLPDYPGFYPFHMDEDLLPKGVINVDTVEADWIANKWPDGYPVASEADRKILVDANNTWWDSRLDDMVANQMPAFPDTIQESWASQMFNMNSRTQAMFDDDEAYPYFVEGVWHNFEPDFANNKDLMTEWISFIVSNSTPGAPGGGDGMPWWRTHDRVPGDSLVFPDWPPLADLSYTQADLLGGGLDGYPVGDLNWFPTEKEAWMATNESEALIARLKNPSTDIDDIELERFSADLEVFPNPFGEMATVRFEISRSSYLELSVYNLLGKRVQKLNLGHRGAGIHEVSLSRGDLKPGMYIIQLNSLDDKAGKIAKISIR